MTVPFAIRGLSRFRFSAGSSCFLLCLFSLPVQSQTFDRQWQEMSMEDVYTYSMSWAPKQFTCKAMQGGGFFSNYGMGCTVALWKDGAPDKLKIWIDWNEPGQQPVCDCRPESHDEGYNWHHPNRSLHMFTQSLFNAGLAGKTEAFKAAYPVGEVFQVYQDIARKLQYFATECDCGGEDLPPREGQSSGPSGESMDPSDQFDELQQADPPGPGLEQSDQVLGQGDRLKGEAFLDQLYEETRDYRPEKRAVRGMPPGTFVESVKLFASGKGMPDRNDRQYRDEFPPNVQYINFEVNLTFPEIRERHPFDLEIWIKRRGTPYVDIKERGYSLEPGWVRSHHEAGYGSADGTFWQPGTYTYIVVIAGDKNTHGKFKVLRGASQ